MERRAHAGRCPSLPVELELEGAGWYYAQSTPSSPSSSATLPDTERKKEYVDLMIEAKDKEQAVFQLYRSYDLQSVIWENLRPAKQDPGFSHDVKEDDVLDEGHDDGGVGVNDGSGTRSSPRKRKASKNGELCSFSLLLYLHYRLIEQLCIDEAEVEAALVLDPEADTEFLEAGVESSPTKKKRKTRATRKGECYYIHRLHVDCPDV